MAANIQGKVMLEHHKKPLLNRSQFIHRQIRYTVFSLFVLTLSIGIGTIGYHLFGELSWIDSFLNASMILTGMGPVDRMNTNAGKIFSALYALFSGISFLTFAAILFAPVYHRFLHKFHLSSDKSK
jgi:hypothetical protein